MIVNKINSNNVCKLNFGSKDYNAKFEDFETGYDDIDNVREEELSSEMDNFSIVSTR